ncbi:DUF1194 domain-containing protein [Sneathiella marina]|uniref:DUF1194 domain-containing protein n=1 Tax=Sneathiella marina TaxID=2950108 RepID=A0ABY4W3V7_9PROT|nr:DUF1194 domain-containing protein [Sneathiella marina]USG61875.1 DUF1194 domain-containing protein [Sneathiella marina]
MKWIAVAITLVFIQGFDRLVEAAEVDVQLVLAIDVSSSVSWDEYGLQMQGVASAFRDELVIEAIQSGPTGRISVAVTQWAGLGQQQTVLSWRVISSPEEAAAMADDLGLISRAFPYGGTAIAEALDHAYALFSRDVNISQRQVIDISGDGKVSIGASPDATRNKIVNKGAIINGLPILDSAKDLESYYQEHVIGGIGAFTEIAESFDDFSRAIAEKLAREIRSTWQGV